jgi:hypothetical protein
MKRLSILALFSFALMYVFIVSCNKVVTYEEKKAAERKIIRRILAEKDIEVLDEYPKDGVFKENQFFQLNSGIYLNVVDSGNGNRAVYDGTNSTDVLVRVSGKCYYPNTTDDYEFNTFANNFAPIEFKYGYAYNVVQEHSQYSSIYSNFFGMGIESILAFVGDSAVVKLLVPGHAEIRSGNSSYSAGSTLQSTPSSYFIPIFYDRVRYTFYY